MRTRTLLIAVVVSIPAFGQAVPSREPTSTHIFPAGGQRGTTVKVRVGGECLPPGMRLKIEGAGVTAPPKLGLEAKRREEPSARRPPRDADGAGAAVTYPREFESEFKIAKNVPPGARLWRVHGAWGGTRPRPFLVGDLPEHIEAESNSRPELAERVRLPIVLNGQIAGERDQDFYVFSAKAGQLVSIDVIASRIGSPLDPVVTISDARGQRVTVQEARVGGDPVVTFTVPADGDYRLHVANLGFLGGPAYVYRITLTHEAPAAFAFPTAGRAGTEGPVAIYRPNGIGGWDIRTQPVRFPAAPGEFDVAGLVLQSSDIPEGLERPGTAPTEMPLPGAVHGQFATKADEDWYQFTARAGERLLIRCEAGPNSPAVPFARLVDGRGQVLATISTAEAVEAAQQLEWIAPADGTYRLAVRDVQYGSRGGAEFVYRVAVRRATDDFSLRLDPDYVNVVQGSRTDVDLFVRRTGTFAGPIELKAVGLPPGVKIEPAVVPVGIAHLKLAFVAAADTRPIDTPIQLVGKATIDKATVERRANTRTFGREVGQLALTIQHKPLFRLSCNEAYQYAHRGTIYPYALTVERLNGFTGPITLQLCDRQVQDLDGVDAVEEVVPPGVTSTSAKVFLPETMNLAAQHHSRPYVQGYATFKDQWGEEQTILALCEKRCMIRTLPPVAKLRAEAVPESAGGNIVVRLTLDRTANFSGTARVEVIAPAGLRGKSATFAPGVTEQALPLAVPADVREIAFRATGSMAGGASLVTEATVTLKKR